ncbi:MAG: BatA domain-containing protein [Melioribacteraceae bacterium]
MTFLNPAILFGLFAASIPVVLHFLNLRKLKKVEFSTLSFLKELQKTKIRRIRIKQWLLLLIRILIIIFLVGAFARPTVKSISIGNSSAAKTTAVIIIDNTSSMSVVTENGSYLNQAKQIAKNLINNFRNGDEIAVIPAGDLSGVPAGAVTNFKQIATVIDEVEISAVSTTLNDALVKAAAILYASKNFNKEVYLISDYQRGRIFNSADDLSDLSGIFNENTRLFNINLGIKDAANLGIEELVSGNQIFEFGKTVSFRARVKNYSVGQAGNSVVSLFVNGKRSAQQSLNLPGGGTKEISFETTLADTGFVEISAELEDDEILPDNKRHLEIFVPGRISMLILTDNLEDAKFIRLASEDVLQKVKVTGSSVARLPSINLSNFNSLFITGAGKNDDWNNLAGYIKRGGKAILMPGSQTTIQNFQKVCGSLGLPAPSNAVGTLNSPDSPSRIDKIDFQNPLFLEMFENVKNPQIESPEIYYYFKINPGGDGKNIISMIDNSSFLSEYKIGRGKVFLFNSAPLLSWSNFPVKGFFAPLINKLIYYSASKAKEQSIYLSGQEITANISNNAMGQIIVQKPGGEREFINTDSLANKNFLFFNKTDELGNYKFYSGNKILDLIAVNHDPRESVVMKASDDDFDNYLTEIGFKGKKITLSPGDDFSKEIYQSRFGTELWKYSLMIVLFLAMLESIVARSSKKELAEIKN